VARQTLGDAVVDRALAEGRAMDLDAAIAFAHQDGVVHIWSGPQSG
jgi:hypothetical protein